MVLKPELFYAPPPPPGNQIRQGARLSLVPIYLGSLLYRVNECVDNIVRSVGCFHVVTHADTTYLQPSYKRGSRLWAPQFDAVDMVEVEVYREVKIRQTCLTK